MSSYLSTLQIVKLWDDLRDCENDRHIQGGRIVKIYAHRLIHAGAYYHTLKDSINDKGYNECVLLPELYAAKGLIDICLLFLENSDINNRITIDGLSPIVWYKEVTADNIRFNGLVHLEVRN